VIAAHGNAVIDRGLILVAEGNRFAIDAEAIQLRPNAGAAVNKALGEPAFVDRVRGRVGFVDATEIPLTFLFNRKAYTRATLPMRQAVRVPAVSAVIVDDGRGFPVTPSTEGRLSNMVALGTAVRRLSQNGPEIEVPTVVVEPKVTTEEAELQAAKARTFVRTRHTVDLKGDLRLVPRAVIRRAAGFDVRERRIAFRVKQAPLQAWFSSIYGKRERPARNARFTATADGKVRIIAGRNGRGVDVGALAAAWMVDPAAAVTPITFGPREPQLTTEEARNLGVRVVVGEFFTEYGGGNRVVNIKRAAEILDQMIIPAGGTFSLNEALGERTEARGFLPAPMIGEGNVMEDAVGGGVSQVATTIFNAAFFAGLEIIEHRPHTIWFSRYPKGREATVSWGGPELVFKNDWNAPIVIVTKTTDAGITIRFLSDRLGRRVETIEGEPYSYSQPRIIRKRDKSLEPGTTKIVQQLGGEGFWIKYGRRVFENGTLRSKQSWTWRYAPGNAIVLVGPKLRPVPVEEEPAVDGAVDGEGAPVDTGEGESVPVEPGQEEVPAGGT